MTQALSEAKMQAVRVEQLMLTDKALTPKAAAQRGSTSPTAGCHPHTRWPILPGAGSSCSATELNTNPHMGAGGRWQKQLLRDRPIGQPPRTTFRCSGRCHQRNSTQRAPKGQTLRDDRRPLSAFLNVLDQSPPLRPRDTEAPGGPAHGTGRRHADFSKAFPVNASLRPVPPGMASNPQSLF